MSELKNPADLSFIIPTYNASFHLERCLRSIRSQKYPQENIEILIIDGDSRDNTIDIANRYNCRIYENKKVLAEYGVQIGMQKATGKFLVVFAADNELVGNDWIEKVIKVLITHPDISALWGRLASDKDDSALNKYFELIQSDPLNWFLNKNLDRYKNKSKAFAENLFLFQVDPARPLVWGANGLVYRAERIKKIWLQDGYLGDNDAFQYMIEQGNNQVAYFNTPFVYHHHVAKLSDWIKKWRRNFIEHLLTKRNTRNMNWVFGSSFKTKLFLWIIYTGIPIFSLIHSIYLLIKDKNIYWLYHPVCCFLQTSVYAWLILTSPSQSLNLLFAQNED